MKSLIFSILKYTNLLIILFFSAGMTSYAQVAVDGSPTTSSGNGTSLSFSHNGGSGWYRLLVVAISYEDGTGNVTGVTYGGAALTKMTETSATWGAEVDLWYRLAPATGSNTVAISTNFSAANDIAATAISFIRVDQADPFAAVSSTSVLNPGFGSVSTDISMDMTINDLAVDVCVCNISLTAAASQTVRGSVNQGSIYHYCSTKPGPSTVDVEWEHLPWALLNASAAIIGLKNTSLPIELLYFTANRENEIVKLEWATGSEKNNDYFTIEQSPDLKTFKTIGTVKGSGNSNNTLNYEFTDPEPLEGIIYYQLKQTDYNGFEKQSGITAIQYTKNKQPFQFIIYPNPVYSNNEVTVNFSNLQSGQEISVVVSDMLGKQLYSKAIISNIRGEAIEILNSDIILSTGIYIIKCSSGDTFLNRKLIIR